MVAGLPEEEREYVARLDGEELTVTWRKFGNEKFDPNPDEVMEYTEALCMITKPGLLDLVSRMIDEPSTRRSSVLSNREAKRVRELKGES